MKSQLEFVFLAAAMMTTVVPPSWAGTIRTDVADSYVEVRVPTGQGSGVVLRVEGEILVLTAAHVTEDLPAVDSDGITTYRPATLVRSVGGKEQTWRADIVRQGNSEGIDLALLRPRDSRGLIPAHFDSEIKPELGEDCWYIGTTAGVHARLERSILSLVGVKLEGKSGSFLATNGCVWHGNSGGGVFVRRSVGKDDVYSLAGIIVCGGPDSAETARPIGYAVDHGTIDKFLKGYRTAKRQCKMIFARTVSEAQSNGFPPPNVEDGLYLVLSFFMGGVVFVSLFVIGFTFSRATLE